MKIGHAFALCCAALALVFGALFYWDLQDGAFSSSLLFLPVLFGTMAGTLALFPGGGGGTLRALLRDPGTDVAGRWVVGIPKLHKRRWIAGAAASIYFSQWAKAALQGQDFFTVSSQVATAIAFGVLYLVLRKPLFQR